MIEDVCFFEGRTNNLMFFIYKVSFVYCSENLNKNHYNVFRIHVFDNLLLVYQFN